jgi:UDP:flavonoid glycosyltransferase YjiC (YdhE family)
MRISILTVGSRGDVQPFMALGLALKNAGHNIVFATHDTFKNAIRDLGFEFLPLEGDIRELLKSRPVREVLTAGGNPLSFIPRFIRASEPLVIETVKGMLVACKDADAVILAGLGFYGGSDVAEKLGITSITAAVQPMQPTRAFHNPFFPAPPEWLPFKGAYNRLSHVFFAKFFWQLVRPLMNKAREEILNLPPATKRPVFKQIDEQKTLSLWGISSTVVPKPNDWAEWHKVTGYWFLNAPSGWQPPEDLVDFMNAGDPPVYIGFGSMNDKDAENLTKIAMQALKIAKCRGILLTGWGAMAATSKSDDIYTADSIPHDWLFPKVAAVVHHGGAGTTAAGFRAGVPTVVIPFAADQFFWADRVVKLGVGATLGSRKKLTAEKLSKAIRAVLTDENIRLRAKRLGESIRQENGLKDAVKEIENNFRAMERRKTA